MHNYTLKYLYYTAGKKTTRQILEFMTTTLYARSSPGKEGRMR